MPVSTQHPEYIKSLAKWQLVRDCDEGSIAVKARTHGDASNSTLNGMPGTTYLPPPNAEDASAENKGRYESYRLRANFVNFTGHTREGMLGMVFRKETVIVAPTSIEYLIENANGAGLSSDQMIKEIAAEVLMVGRLGLLVDYPDAEMGMTEAQVKSMKLQANILTYPAESIINWQTAIILGSKVLTLVVLKEPTTKLNKNDPFDVTVVMYHRVLLLKDGIYVQNLYDEDDNLVSWETGEVDATGVPVMTGDIIPRQANGSTWTEIPFIFVGSVNNDEKADKAPLYDIAEVNIAHYRNSADYEESSFITGQPTPVLAGLTPSWVSEHMKNGVALGSRTAMLLPEGGSASLLQANANQMPLKGMEIKEAQMVMIGTRIIQDTGGTETAEAAKIRFAGQNSKLSALIGNVENAFYKCYEWVSLFMSGEGDVQIEINREFYDATVDPQMIMAMMQLSDRGVIAITDIRDTLRKGNLISADRTDDEIDDETEDAGLNSEPGFGTE